MLKRPVGLPLLALTAAAGAVLLISDSVPGGNLGWFFVGAVLALLAAAWWLLRLVVWLASKDRSGHGWRFVLAPGLGIVVVALSFTGVPLELRWSRSEAAFDRALADAPPPTAPAEVDGFEVPDRIGSYRVDSAFRQGDAVAFVLDEGGFNHSGFIHLPSGRFDELEYNGRWEHFVSLEPLGGGWYEFTTSF